MPLLEHPILTKEELDATIRAAIESALRRRRRSEPVHGTLTMYTKGKCRCVGCRAAASLYNFNKRQLAIAKLETEHQRPKCCELYMRKNQAAYKGKVYLYWECAVCKSRKTRCSCHTHESRQGVKTRR